MTAKEGDYVNKGQLLISMSNTTLLHNWKSLNNNLEFSSFLFEKQKSYMMTESELKFNLKELENNVERFKKAIATINTQIEKSEILAPFNGYVGATKCSTRRIYWANEHGYSIS